MGINKIQVVEKQKKLAAPEVTEQQIAEARRVYQREYRKNHPDKVRKWQETFWRNRAIRATVNEKKRPDYESR